MRKAISKDGTPIAFDESGKGLPVVLVCGASTSRSTNAPLAALMARHFAVLNYDRRGRGDSGDTLPYAIEREIDDLTTLIDEAGGSAFVFGTSSGAVLALEAAARGLAITKLALWEPPFVVDDRDRRPPADHEQQLTAFIAAGRRGDAVEFFMTKVVGLPPEFAAQARNAPCWQAAEDLAHTLVYDASIMGDYSLPAERYAAVAVPTLVIGGADSPAGLRHAVQAVAAVLPHAERRILQGQTHDVDPEVLAPVLEEFFSQ